MNATQRNKFAHLLLRRTAAATKQRCQDWGELQKQLVKLRTAVVIQQVWSLHLCPLVALPRTADLLETIAVNTHGDVNFILCAAVEEQEIIGWEKLLLGMGSSLWQSLQHHIDDNHPKPPDRSASDWMNGAMHQMLKFSLRCWKTRNIQIHGETYKEQKQKALESARARISHLYASPSKLAPQFRP